MGNESLLSKTASEQAREAIQIAVKDEAHKLYRFCELHRLPHHEYSNLYDPRESETEELLLEHLKKLHEARLSAWHAVGRPAFEKPKFKSRESQNFLFKRER